MSQKGKMRVCFKVVKYLKHPEAYLAFMKTLPVTYGCEFVDLTVLYYDNVDADRVTCTCEDNLTIENYLKSLDKAIKVINKMPLELRNNMIETNQHLL